jgi:hypothetical protein
VAFADAKATGVKTAESGAGAGKSSKSRKCMEIRQNADDHE